MLSKKRKLEDSSKDITSAILIMTDMYQENKGIEEVAFFVNDEIKMKKPKDSNVNDEIKKLINFGCISDDINFKPTNIPCIGLVEITNPDINIVNIVDSIMERVINKKAIFDKVLRIIPIQKIVKVNKEDICNAIKEILVSEKDKESVYTYNESVYTYKVDIRVRRATVNKDSLLDAIIDVIDTKHKVNLKKPEVVFLVEIINELAFVSVITNNKWFKYKKYNVREITTSNN
jgi:tRNA(Ser,Leu) C12 N-acetylase TAN1